MDWSALGGIVGPLAKIGLPALGTLFGGPLGGTIGGVVGTAIAGALGVDPTPQAVATAIQADPNGSAVKLAEIEAETRRRADELADVANARQMETVLVQTGSPVAWAPVAFSGLNYLFVFIMIGLVAMGLLREDGIVVGWIMGAATSAYTYWLGSSDTGKRNADTVRHIAASSVTPSPAQLASKVVSAATGR